jgi:hypothetical protein
MLRHTLLLLFLALTACGSGANLFSPSRSEQWDILTQDDAQSTSRCIGRPETPLCAVETLLACFQRGKMELCRMVDDGTDQYAEVFATPPDRRKFLAYRVLATRSLTSASLPNGHSIARAGDVLLSLNQRESMANHDTDTSEGPTQDFLLRRQDDGRWKIVAWGEAGEL